MLETHPLVSLKAIITDWSVVKGNHKTLLVTTTWYQNREEVAIGVFADGQLMQNMTLDVDLENYETLIDSPPQCHIFTLGHLIDFKSNYTSINQHSGTFLMHKNKMSDFQVQIRLKPVEVTLNHTSSRQSASRFG